MTQTQSASVIDDRAMEDPLGVWEFEGGLTEQTGSAVLTGTVNQIEWARQIRDQVNAEFDRVRTVLELAGRKQAEEDRLDTEAIILILEDKRDEVMAHREAGYF